MRIALIFICLLTVSLFPETVKKEALLPAGSSRISYSSNGAEIAYRTYDKKEKLIETKGKVPDGVVRAYFPDGTVKEEFYVENGLTEGEYKEFRKNGKLKNKWVYKKGKLEGESVSFSEAGKLSYVTVYKDDEPLLRKSYSYLSGKLSYEKEYTGKDTYTIKNYYDNGRLKSVEKYLNRKLDGDYKEYYSSGEIKKTAVYKAGRELTGVSHNKDKQGILIFAVFLFFLSAGFYLTAHLVNRKGVQEAYDTDY